MTISNRPRNCPLCGDVFVRCREDGWTHFDNFGECALAGVYFSDAEAEIWNKHCDEIAAMRSRLRAIDAQFPGNGSTCFGIFGEGGER